jgi:hypothetical protein
MMGLGYVWVRSRLFGLYGSVFCFQLVPNLVL